MEHSGRILVEQTTEEASDDAILIKFVQPSERDTASISKKEIALFSLQRSINKIEMKMTEFMDKASRENVKIKQLIA